MDPPSSASVISSLLSPLRVNAQPHVAMRDLVRRHLAAERRIRMQRPAIDRYAKPARADEVLDALARAFRPGDRVGGRQIVRTAGVNGAVAGEVRRWAVAAGCWPYREALCGFQAGAARARARAGKGGAP
jgi:hypothetical protein